MADTAFVQRYTYDQLVAEFGEDEDGLRRELIDGELIVSPSPRLRHQAVARELLVELTIWARRHGGKTFMAPLDVKFSDVTVLEPDVLLVRAEHLDLLTERFIAGAPDVVVEVSSPSTRHVDLVRKRAVYETFGVAEYWFVDLDHERVEVHRLVDGVYPAPRVLQRGDVLESPEVPGFSVPVAQLLDV